LKPAPFKYLAAESAEEALAALEEYGGEAKILAGGQSLVPLMNLRLAAPSVLVDLNGVAELGGLRLNGALEVGAVTRQAAVERSAEAAEIAPMLVDALRYVAHPAVRSRGTIGGTVAHADPAAEIPAVLLALGGEIVARGPGGERAIAADDFFVSYFTTTLDESEIVTHVRIPRPPDRLRWGFLEVARKHSDFALVGVALAADVGDAGECSSARIALFGVADRPVRARRAEEALVGRSLGDTGARGDAARLASEEIEPREDGHATREYRRNVAGVLVRRALEQAAAREGGAR
jgi:CO/xanthine dehydrogenase FAD-binding subunit